MTVLSTRPKTVALDYIFYPESIAIVGVSTENSVWRAGQMYLEGLTGFGYKGRIYLVNRKGGEIQGFKLYRNLAELPEIPDLVVCCVGASQISGLIDECIARRVKAVTVFTGGFSERNGAEGKAVERDMCDRVRRGGLRLLGPNCLGPYCPEVGLSPGADYPKKSGTVGLICQSGGNSIQFVRSAAQRGIYLNKGISFGNACDINECDLLEYMAADPAISLIVMYMEGVRDGRRFFKLLRETTARKPVAILKAGITEAGARAAASHSGSLAASDRTWEALFRQTGAIRVNSVEEMIDLAVTWVYMPPVRGRRTGLVGQTGGATVLATDDLAAGNLVVSKFSSEIKERLAWVFGHDPGVIVDNPVDESTHGFTDGIYEALKVVQDADVDLLMVHIPIGLFLLPANFPELKSLGMLVNDTIRIHREGSLPMAVVLYAAISARSRAVVLEYKRQLWEAGLPVYTSIKGAARAIDRVATYRERFGER